jgi:Ca2+-binding EF-hand superfamily protein
MKSNVLYLSLAAVLALCVVAEARPRHRHHFGGFGRPPAMDGGDGETARPGPQMAPSEERKLVKKGFLLARVADTDDSRSISAEEWQAFLDSLNADEEGAVDMDALVEQLPEPKDGREIDVERLSAVLDVDDDGVVEIEDLQTIFDALDANEDGELMTAETRKRKRFGKKAKRRGGKVVRLADADESGDVTAEEWDDFLASLGADDEGVFDVQTLIALLPEREDGFPEGFADKLARMLDRDRDELLELEDLEEIFLQLDKDGDGALSEDEIPGKPPVADPSET